MKLDITDLDEQLFDAFGGVSSKRYLFMTNLKTGVTRWAKNIIKDFDMPSFVMTDSGERWGSLVHPDDYATYYADIQEVLSGRKHSHHMDYRVKNKDGDYVIVTCDGKIVSGDGFNNPDLFVGVVLNHGVMENIDASTSLYNIYEFWNHIRNIKKKGKDEMVLMIGINNFSEINDVFGYEFGNKVLKSFGQKLLEIVRGKGLVFRNDGVRFACCLSHFSQEDTKNLYREIREIGKREIVIDGVQISISLSAGAVLYNDLYDENTIQTSARYALGKSKHEQYGQLVFFDENSLSQNQKTVEFTNVIRKSVLQGCEGFYLCYQPIMDAGREHVIGAEALVRWHGEGYGEISPGLFIPWLENDACFYELGAWILENAMMETRLLLNKCPDFTLNVNLAYPQLIHEGFIEDLAAIIERTGFPAKNLCLELTERCRQVEHKVLYDIIVKMKKMGIRIALDDFGTGFSSLNLLSDLPIDVLKIDRGFIWDIESNHSNQCIVKAVTNCAKDMDVHVCMEGLETREMIDFVKKYPVYSYQGYYFSKPVTKTAFMERFCG